MRKIRYKVVRDGEVWRVLDIYKSEIKSPRYLEFDKAVEGCDMLNNDYEEYLKSWKEAESDHG